VRLYFFSGLKSFLFTNYLLKKEKADNSIFFLTEKPLLFGFNES